MIVNRAGAVGDLYPTDEVFDFYEDDLISESGSDSSEEENLDITPQLPGNTGALISKAGNILVDPNISADDKFKTLALVVGIAGQQFQQDNQEKDKLNRNIAQLQDNFGKAKNVYEERLQDLEDLNAQLQEQLEEISIKNEKEEWIADNIDKVGVYTAGPALGIAGVTVGMMGALALGVTNLPALPILVIGAGKGISSVREIQIAHYREVFKELEEKYLEENPTASKRDAFEYVKEIIEKTKYTGSPGDD